MPGLKRGSCVFLQIILTVVFPYSVVLWLWPQSEQSISSVSLSSYRFTLYGQWPVTTVLRLVISNRPISNRPLFMVASVNSYGQKKFWKHESIDSLPAYIVEPDCIYWCKIIIVRWIYYQNKCTKPSANKTMKINFICISIKLHDKHFPARE